MLFFLSFSFFCITQRTSASSIEEQEKHYVEYLFVVDINQLKTGDSALFLEDHAGDILANSLDLLKWRFILPKNLKTIDHEGQSYYRLKDFSDLTYAINKKEMEINLVVPNYHFNPNVIELSKEGLVTPMEPSLGTYFNYDTIGQKTEDFISLSGVFSVNLFNKFGTGFSDFLGQHQDTPHCKKDKFVRLNSNWRYDDPKDMETLILGDSYTVPGLWGNSVGLGGIFWGTNFQTQPSFITFPLPSAKGVAVAPSLVDLYINDTLIGKHSTNLGPFDIKTIPATTGAGTVNLVTTDLLGRQQIVNVPFYVSTTLLTAGLQKYDYSLGFIRKNFGFESNNYRNFAFSGNHLVGVTNNFTSEAHLELLQNQQTFGIGGNYLLSTLGVFTVAGAMSFNSDKTDSHKHNKNSNHSFKHSSSKHSYHPHTSINHSLNKPGGLFSGGFQRQAQDVSFGGNIQTTSKSFVQLGTFPGRAPRYQLTSFIGLNLYDGASTTIGYIRQENRYYPRLSLLNANFNQTLSKDWYFHISALSNVGGRKHQSIFVTLTYALNDRTTLNVSGNGQRHANQGTVQVTRSLPLGPGYGYNLYAANGQRDNYQGTFSAQNDMGTCLVGVAQQDNVTSGQVQASGAIVFLNKNAYLTRKVYQSFAVVEVPGYADVGVYSQNQIIGKTGEDGTVLVPQLLEYQNNPIRVDLDDLPIDANIEKGEMNVIPYYRSGLVVKFPIKPSSGATMKLTLPSGEPLPVGALVKLKTENIPVGREGEVYITGLEEHNTLSVEWGDEVYTCNVPYQKSEDPLPDLGTIQCQK
ncbi:MAG: fimbria/pilus outer membrane usher protein [Alphaproteobacteria bacterium]|nr:fimbria/pilus outer membrane usher protein [Alphaproteobacteria bacterium]